MYRAYQNGYWLLLFAGSDTLKHTQKMGDAGSGFGDIKTLLQTALQYECLSMVLVNYSDDYYQANSRDMKYNINLITAACNISIILLDHLVMEPDGYFSYRDNGLLTYMEN
jgi:DNA repair protein RadC